MLFTGWFRKQQAPHAADQQAMAAVGDAANESPGLLRSDLDRPRDAVASASDAIGTPLEPSRDITVARGMAERVSAATLASGDVVARALVEDGYAARSRAEVLAAAPVGLDLRRAIDRAVSLACDDLALQAELARRKADDAQAGYEAALHELGKQAAPSRARLVGVLIIVGLTGALLSAFAAPVLAIPLEELVIRPWIEEGSLVLAPHDGARLALAMAGGLVATLVVALPLLFLCAGPGGWVGVLAAGGLLAAEALVVAAVLSLRLGALAVGEGAALELGGVEWAQASGMALLELAGIGCSLVTSLAAGSYGRAYAERWARYSGRRSQLQAAERVRAERIAAFERAEAKRNAQLRVLQGREEADLMTERACQLAEATSRVAYRDAILAQRKALFSDDLGARLQALDQQFSLSAAAGGEREAA